MESKKVLTPGGQAVIEGVMMRCNDLVATAVRLPNGEITIDKKHIHSLGERYPVLKKPFLRGVLTLFESLLLGMKALSYSAKQAGEEEETLSDKDLILTMFSAFAVAIFLFLALPTGIVKIFHGFTDNPLLLNVLEGIFRMLIFLAYIYAISRIPEIYRVFQYHGAEHKTIHAYENNGPLTVNNVQKFSTLHPRCGTSFLLMVMVVSIFVFAFSGWPNFLERLVSRILLLPIVAGISYEIIRFSATSTNPIVHLFILPGLYLQKLTTNEPKDEMVEVAIEALVAVLPKEEQQKMGFIKRKDIKNNEHLVAIAKKEKNTLTPLLE